MSPGVEQTSIRRRLERTSVLAVLLDALPQDIGSGFTARPHPQWPVLELEIEQQLPSRSGEPQVLRSRLAA